MDERIVRPPLEQEVNEEVRFHVEMRVRELMAKGMGEGEARVEALRRFGNVDRVKADMRHQGEGRDAMRHRRQWWDEARQDVAFAVRQLRRSPTFALVAIVTLALAIGANTSVFSVVNGVLLKPLPYPRPDQLVDLWTRYLPPSGFDIPKFAISGPELLDYKDETKAFSSLGAFEWFGSRALTGDGQEAERVQVTFVGAALLPTLGVKPRLGRWFTQAEDTPDGPAVTILGHDLWVRRYGADPGIVGRSILMNGTPTQVVGVMPSGFMFGPAAQAYLPLGITRANEGSRGSHSLHAVGRLAPGATLADVDAELAVVRDRWAKEYEHNVGHFLVAFPMRQDLLGDARGVLVLLLSAVALVLLIACANMANLLLARGERRLSEVALRRALGAGRGRIVRQLVTESVVLSVLACVVAVPLAVAGTRLLIALDPKALPRLAEVHVDLAALGFTLLVALVTAVLFGVAPAWTLGRRGATSAAGSAERAVGGKRQSALRRLVVGAEVAVSLVVVILAGLLTRSFRAMVSTDPGFQANQVLAFNVSLPGSAYPDDAAVKRTYLELMQRLRQVPGVADASGGTFLPLAGDISRWDFDLDDRPPRHQGDKAWNSGFAQVLPGYFRALGIPILQGRDFTKDDDADAPLVGIISESMARTYWPGQNPLGKHWGYDHDDGSTPWITVVGVAADPILDKVGGMSLPVAYIPELQAARAVSYTPRALNIAVRAGVDPGSVTTAVRAAVREIDPDLPMANVRVMRDVVSASMARPRLTTSLLGTFALLALLLATVGVYGVVAYSVAGRTREIGVRVALGAGRGDVIRLVTREGALPVVLGVLLGVVGAWSATRLVRAMLYQVAPNDTLTFTTLPVVLLAVGVLASLVPALRATRISPTEALREE